MVEFIENTRPMSSDSDVKLKSLRQLRVDSSTPKPRVVGGRYDGKQVVVIKIGTTSLINSEFSTLNLSAFAGLAETVRKLKDNGCHVVIISSGAVGVGCQRLGLSQKPTDLSKRQALAAIGQVHLMRFYEDMFSASGLKSAQVLVTLDNLNDKQGYNNAVNTFHELLEYGVIPIVNENDTVAVRILVFRSQAVTHAHSLRALRSLPSFARWSS